MLPPGLGFGELGGLARLLQTRATVSRVRYGGAGSRCQMLILRSRYISCNNQGNRRNHVKGLRHILSTRQQLRDVQIMDTDTMSARRHLRPDVVDYLANIRDWDGSNTSYTFEHHVPHETFEQAVARPDVAGALAQDIASQHYDELLTDRHWRCCKCGGKATRLFMHPLPYLHLVQPTIADMPGPVCSSLCCEKSHLEEYRKGLGGVLTERVETKSVVAAVAALMALAVVIVISVI